MPIAHYLFAVLLLAPQLQQAPPPQQPQTPANPPKATAVVRGRVAAADTGLPARRAQVRMTRTGTQGPNQTMSTTVDADGNYEFTALLPGRYIVSAAKSGYVDGSGRPPLEIREGQFVEHVDFALARGAVITGRISDETGDPISGVQVSVLRVQGSGEQQRIMPGFRPFSTDDLGSFRMYGLTPGDYVLQAMWRQGMSGAAEALGRTGYAPTYFPGTTDALSAQRFTVRANQTLSDIVMTLIPVATVRVSGSVVDSHGALASNGAVMLTQARTDGPVLGMMVNSSAPLRDGTFTFPGVSPGQYTLQKISTGADSETATMELSVGSDDISDVQLMTSPPLRVSGRLVFEPGSAPPAARPRLNLVPVGQSIGMMSQQSGLANADFTFELKAPPGVYRLQAQVMPPPWTISAVRVGGADVIDDGIEVKPGRDVTGIEVDVTSRTQTITGTVSAPADQLKDSAVLVFPSDPKKMKYQQRYGRTARPDQNGRFTISGLPPGEYQAIALEHFSPGPQPTAELLERLRTRSTSVTLLEGETRAVDLRLNASQ